VNGSRRRSPRDPALVAIAALILAAIACQVDVGGPQPPGPPIGVSPDASLEVREMWRSALRTAAETGEFTILLSETQLTSYFDTYLSDRPGSALEQPQIFLRDGRLQVFGYARQGPLQASVLISVLPVVTPSGELGFSVGAADLGPLPAPDALRESLSALLTEAFTGTLGSLATGIRIKEIAIAEGHLALIGELR
jgi:hypothetical protein